MGRHPTGGAWIELRPPVADQWLSFRHGKKQRRSQQILIHAASIGQVIADNPRLEQQAVCFLHADADRFYFAVEALERPELASDPRPIIVGHDPRESPRAVVTTANDAARGLGIDSGLSCRVALTRAPDALFLPPRFPIYREYSLRLMETLRAASPSVEQLSVDEAWLDWTEHGFSHEAACDLRQRVREVTGLSVSVGVATSKLLAKMATEQAKSSPDHVKVVPTGGEDQFLEPLPVNALWGVGPKTAERLRGLGLETIGQIAGTPVAQLIAQFGPIHGRVLADHSHGIDRSILAPVRQAKSYSAERTFQTDTADRTELWATIQRQAQELGARLIRMGLTAREVGFKIRYADWVDLTRQSRLAYPTASAEIIAHVAADLMRKHWERGREIRLIGIRVSALQSATDPAQLTLPGVFADQD
jgi:DNA polymerase-4